MSNGGSIHGVASAILGLFLSSCAVTASRADYADYRAIRLATDERDRSIAMGRYLERHPDGRWVGKVRGEFGAAEERSFEQAKSSPEGLRSFLRVFPNGRFASEASTRLVALERVHKGSAHTQARAQRRQGTSETPAAVWLEKTLAYWTARLASLQGWSRPLSEVAAANPEFSAAYGERPRASCYQRRCAKVLEAAYAVPVPGGTRLDRQLGVQVRLELDQGALTEAVLVLPERGFSRWFEAARRTLVTDEDETQRKEALDWARGRIGSLVRAVLPGAHAEADEIAVGPIGEWPPKGKVQEAAQPESSSPTVLGGWRAGEVLVLVVAASAEEPLGYDGILVRPAGREESRFRGR